PDLFGFIGSTLTFFTVLSVVSLFKFRKRAGWQRLRAVNFAYPLFPVLYIVVGLAMMVNGILFQPNVSIAVIGMLVAGALVYHFAVAKKPALDS
ncbi:MAG: amino acid permease, partial [Bryobacteraceae bacterium]